MAGDALEVAFVRDDQRTPGAREAWRGPGWMGSGKEARGPRMTLFHKGAEFPEARARTSPEAK